jgi:hypothetical protein
MEDAVTSPSKTTVESSFCWLRKDNNYTSLGGASVVDGLLYYCQQKGIGGKVFGRELAKEIDKYFIKRDLNVGKIIEDRCKYSKYNNMFKGTFYIKSRDKDEKIEHKVRVSDVVSKNSTEERKDLSLRSMNLLCDCPSAHYQMFVNVPLFIRKLFGDYRRWDSTPSPHVSIPICTHSVACMDWLVEERGAEDFGIFGLNDRTTKFAKYMIRSALDKNTPENKLNEFLRDDTDLFDPLWERLGIEKVKILKPLQA